MPTYTTNYDLAKPLVNDPTDQDLWGGYLNEDIDSIDSLLLASTNWVPTTLSATTLLDGNYSKNLVLCDSNSGSFQLTMPDTSDKSIIKNWVGFTVAIKKTDSGSNTVTIAPQSTETFDGQASLTISSQYGMYILSYDGSNWQIVNRIYESAHLGGIPTANTASAGTQTTQLATTLFCDPAHSIATNGYQKLSSGLVIQWGEHQHTSTGAETISFPVAFTTACLNVQATQKENFTLNANIRAYNYSKTGFSCVNGDGYSGLTSWFAIGN